MRENMDFNKYENIIRVGNSPSNLSSFPTPSSIGYLLADVDKDPFTDLQGYTHRNRVRHDVLSLELGYSVLSEDDLAFILNAISNVWVYVEVTEKKSKARNVYKMYASDKQFNTFRFIKDENNVYHEFHQDFSVTLVQE